MSKSILEEIKSLALSNNISPQTLSLLLHYYYKDKFFESTTEAISKEYLLQKQVSGSTVTSLTNTGMILLLKKPTNLTKDRLVSLATKLKELYPKGKKAGTSKYWTDGIPLIERRLKMFFDKYGDYSDEDIIDATSRYVASFNNDYSYMRLLKYFIFKEDINNPTSDLLNFIENKEESINNIPNDWTDNLI